MKKPTKKAYEEYLNEASPEQGDASWIIGGSIRMKYMWQNLYGKAIRKHDPTAFEVGYNEWVRENEEGTEEGDICNVDGCKGELEGKDGQCKCHINAPCWHCVQANLTCSECEREIFE